MSLDQVAIAQIDAVLADYQAARGRAQYADFSGGGVTDDERHALFVRIRSAVLRFGGQGSAYAAAVSIARPSLSVPVEELVVDYAGVLAGLRKDIAAGHMQTVEELVHAELFDDFLEAAADLREKGYKDAAAVITGSVLEEHLRKLAAKAVVDVLGTNGKPKTADMLNADLKKGGVYNQLQQKSITALLDLRNKAAHGHYAEYDESQVARMIEDVRSLILRHPA